MNIRKWKDSPALKETRDMLEIKLEDKKVRGILNWIFQIAVVLYFWHSGGNCAVSISDCTGEYHGAHTAGWRTLFCKQGCL